MVKMPLKLLLGHLKNVRNTAVSLKHGIKSLAILTKSKNQPNVLKLIFSNVFNRFKYSRKQILTFHQGLPPQP